MDIYFDRMKKRAEVLGNQYKKYVLLIEKNIDGLLWRLEKAAKVESVHLWASTHDYKDEMSIIARLSSDTREKLDDLSCYFAIQLLQLNLSALDALMFEVTTSDEKYRVYKQFMLRVGHDFRRLTAAYMNNLLSIFLPYDKKVEFVILGVGTRSDQDDIDVGVVDKDRENRDILNNAIARMGTEMFKKAISLHFHLSEHVAQDKSFSASIEEYIRLLETEIRDFVIITEMLGAARIVGSRKLFFEFRRQVTTRYFYDPENTSNAKFHEGYLRGIVGEIRSFMLRDPYRDRINPKSDGLRMIKGSLYAAKTIFSLRQVNAWAIIETLKARDHKRKEYYDQIEPVLSFLEIFRYLFQLIVTQEEEFYLNDESNMKNLAIVAKAMGYTDYGAALATDFLITDYYNHIRRAKGVTKEVIPDFVDHLSSITVLGKMLRHKKATEEGKKRIGNLAIRFIAEAKFFRGTRFWDDIIDVLARKDGLVLKRLVNDLCRLEPAEKEKYLNEYIEWGWNSFIATFSFSLLLHRYRNELTECMLYKEFNERFFAKAITSADVALRLSIVFKNYPKLLYKYLSLLTKMQQNRLYDWLCNDVWDQEVLPDRDRFQFLIKLFLNTSKYFKRIMNKVLDSYPEYLNYISEPEQLLLIGKGKLAEVERAQSFKHKLDLMETYHNFEFFRVCLNTLQGGAAQANAMEFIAFSDTYLRMLFDLCKKDVDRNKESVPDPRDLLGIFVTGGHGQMLAFDDDYDLIILINSDDERIIEYSSTIISRMHREIVKCGILPHYRFADYSNNYVLTFKQLKKVLAAGTREDFIDMSQLLVARMIVGSSNLQQVFYREILKPFIFDKKKYYIQQILWEMHNRERHYLQSDDKCIDLKEAPGGNRDIEMILFICRALYEIREHSNFALLKQMQYLAPALSSEFRKLYGYYQLFRTMRNLNRLIVAADDVINKNYLQELANSLNIESNGDDNNFQILFEDIEKTIKASAKTIKRLKQQLVTIEK